MAWLEKNWWKMKDHTRHHNGNGTRIDSKTFVMPPKIGPLTESVDPRRALAWMFAMAAIVVYGAFRWNKINKGDGAAI